jgi:hypothetical protein
VARGHFVTIKSIGYKNAKNRQKGVEMEQKRETIVNQLIANIEKAIGSKADIETAIVNFRHFLAALELENAIRNSESEKQK